MNTDEITEFFSKECETIDHTLGEDALNTDEILNFFDEDDLDNATAVALSKSLENDEIISLMNSPQEYPYNELEADA